MIFTDYMKKTNKPLFVGLAILCLFPIISAPIALVMGIAFVFLFGNPFPDLTRQHTTTLLGISIIGLGAAMNLNDVLETGVYSMTFTALSVLLVLLIGLGLTHIFNIKRETGFLISAGTAICGGSAIACLVPILNAKPENVSVSLAIVFILNAVALFVFPIVGGHFGLDQSQFGLWSALAIHDTSSVIGASLQYGPEALEVGTTAKLARTLWIIPVMLGTQFILKTKQETQNAKKKFPWFIIGFIAMAALVSYVPALEVPGEWIALCARQVLILCLFLIGASLSLQDIKQVGTKPFLFGITLWLVVAGSSLLAIKLGMLKI